MRKLLAALGILTLLAPMTASAALTDNLLAYFKYDGTANDATSNAHNGTASNVSWVTGKLGSNAASFNGSNSSISDTSYAYGLNLNNHSVSFWIKYTTGGTVITSSFGTNNEDTPTIDTTGGNITAQTTLHRYSSGPTLSATTAIGGLNDNNWHHVIVTVSGGTSMVIYVDGVSRATGSSASVAVNSNVNRMSVGTRAWDQSAWFNGTIDELAFWDRALTSAEVTQLYNSSLGLQYPLTTTAAPLFQLWSSSAF